MTLAMAIDVPAWAIVAPRTVPLEKSLRSSIGALVRRSWRMNAVSAPAEPMIDMSVMADSQPCSTPLVSE